MNFIDDLGLDDNFDGSTASNSDENLSEKNASSGTQKHKVDFQADSRRKLRRAPRGIEGEKAGPGL